MSTNQATPQPAAGAEKKNRKTSPWKKIIILAVILVVFLLLTNPSLMFFLPEAWRDSMKEAYGGLFGDVDQVTKVIHFNWISIFKVIVIVLFMMILKALLKLLLEKIKPKTPKGASVLSMVKSFSGYAIALIMLIWCLSAIGINLSTIFASIGIVALIIGFAAESLIEDVVTGLFLVFEDEFNVGDIIEYNGFRGTVINIGVRVTSIQDPGGNIKLVNNSDLRNVLNRSRTNSNAICDIPISYAANLAETEEILKGIAAGMPAKYPGLFHMPPQYLGVQALDASSVNLRFIAKVNESDIYTAARTMFREFKIGMDEAGVEIPFQQVVIHQGDK
ncbi:MAG: mechanosensitive ion channel family protein [Lachnospiraceae bacterium]|jgi:small conductance mechanosensitive channel|nr:mechanosensitive ion channel family protein [Lachnospiraceae bacterium]